MSKHSTRVINEFGQDIQLRRGTRGIFRSTGPVVSDGCSFMIRSSEASNAEWRVVADGLGTPQELVFTSDDCIEFKEIIIRSLNPAEMGIKGMCWSGERRKGQAEDDLSDAEEIRFEVNALLNSKEQPKFTAALENFERREEHFGVQIERKLARKAELNTDIFNIVGFFSVFQGVILTAVSQLKSDDYSTCGVILFPIILTGLAAVVGIAALWSKFASLRILESAIKDDQSALMSVVRRAAFLRRAEAQSSAGTSASPAEEQSVVRVRYSGARPNDETSLAWQPPDESPWSRLLSITRNNIHHTICNALTLLRRWGGPERILVFLAMILFTVIFILSYFAILCDRFVIHKWKGL